MRTLNSTLQGTLYDPRFEHDGCGIGFVADVSGRPDHAILALALQAVANMSHRGGVDADARTGDGAGVLTQLPHKLMARALAASDRGMPDPGDLAVGVLFLPRCDQPAQEKCQEFVVGTLEQHGLPVLGWRPVPVDPSALGHRAYHTRPEIQQVLLGRPAHLARGEPYERALYLVRKEMEARARQEAIEDFHVPSLSSRTIVYKGLLASPQLAHFYPDLADPDYETALAVFHQRYSTNTFPSWDRAQPFRLMCHNGEINTLQGNVNWMRAREAGLRSPLWGEQIGLLRPVINERGSDSAMLDNVLELLVRSGRDIRHALMMLIPEAWENIPDLDPARRAFYRYHACLMEPWDGPAAVAFTDGTVVGTALDRNGLRPLRYLVTEDGLVVCASEAGALEIDPARVVQKGKLGPGQMLAVDTARARLLLDDEVKEEVIRRQPYEEWAKRSLGHLRLNRSKFALRGSSDPRSRLGSGDPSRTKLDLEETLVLQQLAFGYTSEELTVVLRPMMQDGSEPVGSMGDDTPHAVLTDRPRPLFNYFKQRFAQVTNPPIDPLREELVMSLTTRLGRRGNLLAESPEHAHLVELPSPILRDEELQALRELDDPALASVTLSALFPVAEGPAGLARAVERLCQEAKVAVHAGNTILVLSDRGVDATWAPIPTLLAVGAVHHYLIRQGLRMAASLVAETGEAREVHHFAALIGYGANAVNPWLALTTVEHLAQELGVMDSSTAVENYVKAAEKGLLKIMSKMGISTVDSYCGAQIFEAIGLNRDLVEGCFAGTPCRIDGLGFEDLARETLHWHRAAFGYAGNGRVPGLPSPGFYKFKREGEYHAFNPDVVKALHKAVQTEGVTDGNFQQGYRAYRAYADLVNRPPQPVELRDLLDFKPGPSIPLDEVEPVEAILPRFSTGAMSHGALSAEAHETLAVAMNRLGGMSNSGEGGEDPARFGTERNSRAKQVASGRFGVTPAYLVSADELQIKMAQGSKPGEGGQLPGHKVTAEIAAIRHTVPGVTLISPPPHHDIYSIEDLAQLIYDLKQINPQARVSVKLVAEAGVGTIAAGVAKGFADVILISGHNGGTGASPLSSIKNAGIPWELGLAETQQTLVINGLRGRVRLRVDGGLRSGRDVVIAAMLGADEFSFGTAALVAEGCLMARACHSNTCPTGIASQRPELRARFPGTPEMVMNFFIFVAQEVREILAQLGFRRLDEVIGRSDLLEQVKRTCPEPCPEPEPRAERGGSRRDSQRDGAKAGAINLGPMLTQGTGLDGPRHGIERGNRLPGRNELNLAILRDAAPALAQSVSEKWRSAPARGEGRGAVTIRNSQFATCNSLLRPVRRCYRIRNTDRTIGAALAGAVARQYGDRGLPEGSIELTFYGSAGQSFGAFCTSGVHLTLIGEANDYVGKGMAGGRIVVRPPEGARYPWHESAILGNTVLYGATGGELYAAGRAGERFAVRNSGACAVVEGVGDHGCEYMTGGTVVVLGETGRNFAAGMTGGQAYVLDLAWTFERRCNLQLVRIERVRDSADETRLWAMVHRHARLTGSPHAWHLLDHWPAYLPIFWKVVPRFEGTERTEGIKGTEGTEVAPPALLEGV